MLLIWISTGFCDVVESIDYPMSLTSTAKGPLFESTIYVRSYPMEFIFAEKLETVVYRGMGNTRMKDFHDLYSLILMDQCLNPSYTNQAIAMVFSHRQTSLDLPLRSEAEFIDILEPLWHDYLKNLSLSQKKVLLPKSIREVIISINSWLMQNTILCSSKDRKL